MARAASAPKKEISMEEALWKSADKLRGSVEPAEYKHVVLSLFFLKFASDKFEAQRKAISEKYGEKFVDNVAFYTKDNVFFLPEISRWSFIMENAKQDDIALKIDTALYTIEKSNPARILPEQVCSCGRQGQGRVLYAEVYCQFDCRND